MADANQQKIIVPNKEIFTSNLSSQTLLRADKIEPIAVCRGVPNWFKGRSMKALAPTFAMLKMSYDEYDVYFNRILSGLDPEACWNAMPERAALLCWEAPHVRCHRRAVAEWLEKHLNVVVPEYGFERGEYPDYLNMAKHQKKGSAPRKPKTKVDRDKRRGQSFLFSL